MTVQAKQLGIRVTVTESESVIQFGFNTILFKCIVVSSSH